MEALLPHRSALTALLQLRRCASGVAACRACASTARSLETQVQATASV